MNELLRNVLTRRSIRNFDARQISDSELSEVLEAGKFVSSAIKNQVWHFTVIQNRGILDKINTQNSKFFAHYGKELFKESGGEENLNFLCKAPTLIVVSGRDNESDTQDAANAAFGNMMLAAEKINVGACWTHSLKLLFDAQLGKELLQEISVPVGYLPLCCGVFGYRETAVTQGTSVFQDGIVHIIR